MNKYIKIVSIFLILYSFYQYSSEPLSLAQQLATMSWTLSVKESGILEKTKQILLQTEQKEERSFSTCSSDDAESIANSQPLHELFTNISKPVSTGFKKCFISLLTGENTEEQLVVTPTKIEMRDKTTGIWYCSSPLKKN